MKNGRWGSLLVMLCTLAGVALLSTDASAQKTKGKTRPALTKHLMKGLVAANCGALKKDLDAEKPNWDDIELHAALLNEAGYILLDDGRCPEVDLLAVGIVDGDLDVAVRWITERIPVPPVRLRGGDLRGLDDDAVRRVSRRGAL